MSNPANAVDLVFSYAENDQATELDALLDTCPDKNAIFNAINVEGFYPLHAATMMNSPEAVKILLKHGANPKASALKGKYQGYVPLELAMQRRYRPLINILEPLTNKLIKSREMELKVFFYCLYLGKSYLFALAAMTAWLLRTNLA